MGDVRHHDDRPGDRSPRMGLLAGLVALFPAVVAVWAFPGFVTQDGPAHLYNAHILAKSIGPASPFRGVFAVRWEPLPNWAGHLALMGLVGALPPRAADRLMTTAMLVGFAGSVGWLRWRVAGGRGLATAAVLAVALGLNVTWLLGFSSFMLGAALMPVTLGVWWAGRTGGFSGRRAGALAGLTVLGYFCHVVSLGLTAFGLVVLDALTPGRDRRGRASGTALGLLPILPLGWLYLGLTRRGGGGMAPEWGYLSEPFSARAWVAQLTWVDPVSLARKDLIPLADGDGAGWGVVFAPVLWLAAGVALAAVGAWRRGEGVAGERRGWWVLAGLLLVGGVLSPDTMGASHGHYLPQRIVLLGLAVLVPVLRFETTGTSVVLAVALGLQSATVWDYARASERSAGRLLKAGGAVGTGQRVAALLIGIPTPFRANPLLHADCALGVGTGNVIWGDYETRFYYFPVRVAEGLDHPDPAELEWIALHGSPADSAGRAARWGALLERHHRAIDVVVVWGRDAGLDALTARWFVPVYEDGPVRVFRRRPG